MSRSVSVMFGLILLCCAPVRASQWLRWEGNAHRYRLTSPDLTWEQAEAEAIASGGHLVSIESAEEDAWLSEQFGNASGFVIWIGLYQLPDSAEPDEGWVWSDGEPVTYTNWLDGNPNNGGVGSTTNENYGPMYGAAHADATKWNDIDVGPHAPTHIGPGIIELSGAVPATSQWGLLVLALAVAVVGTAMNRRMLASTMAPRNLPCGVRKAG